MCVVNRPEIDRLFQGLSKKQKLALARRDAREIAHVFNDAMGHRMYDRAASDALLVMCDRYAKKVGAP